MLLRAFIWLKTLDIACASVVLLKQVVYGSLALGVDSTVQFGKSTPSMANAFSTQVSLDRKA